MVTLLPSLWEWRVQFVLAHKPTWTDRITYTRRRRNRRWLVHATRTHYQADAIYMYPKLRIKYGAAIYGAVMEAYKVYVSERNSFNPGDGSTPVNPG